MANQHTAWHQNGVQCFLLDLQNKMKMANQEKSKKEQKEQYKASPCKEGETNKVNHLGTALSDQIQRDSWSRGAKEILYVNLWSCGDKEILFVNSWSLGDEEILMKISRSLGHKEILFVYFWSHG